MNGDGIPVGSAASFVEIHDQPAVLGVMRVWVAETRRERAPLAAAADNLRRLDGVPAPFIDEAEFGDPQPRSLAYLLAALDEPWGQVVDRLKRCATLPIVHPAQIAMTRYIARMDPRDYPAAAIALLGVTS